MPFSSISLYGQNFDLSYTFLNLNAQTDIVFLHGWGSNKEALMGAFANQEILKKYRLIFVDLPGFGLSSNEVALETMGYKSILQLFFEQVGIEPKMIVGHSFGGKVATLLNPKCVVLLSSAGIVEPKPFGVWLKIYAFKVFKIFGFGFLRRFFVADDGKKLTPNMYETFKRVVDEDFKDLFAKSTSCFSVFWGKDDLQTSLASGQLIADLTNADHFEILDGDHFFFTDPKNAKKIAKHIHETLKE